MTTSIAAELAAQLAAPLADYDAVTAEWTEICNRTEMTGEAASVREAENYGEALESIAHAFAAAARALVAAPDVVELPTGPAPRAFVADLLSAADRHAVDLRSTLDLPEPMAVALIEHDRTAATIPPSHTYPEGTHREDMRPRDALVESLDLWGSGAWQDDNAVDNLAEVMGHLSRLIDGEPAATNPPADLWGWQGDPRTELDDDDPRHRDTERPAPEGLAVFAHWSASHDGINVEVDLPDGLALTVHVNDGLAFRWQPGEDPSAGLVTGSDVERRAELAELVNEFDAAGGRGPELADRIDALRAVLGENELPAAAVDVRDAVLSELDIARDHNQAETPGDYAADVIAALMRRYDVGRDV